MPTAKRKSRNKRRTATTRSEPLTVALAKYGADAARLEKWLRRLLSAKDGIVK